MIFLNATYSKNEFIVTPRQTAGFLIFIHYPAPKFKKTVILNHLFISRNRLRLAIALTEGYRKTWCWVNFVLRRAELDSAIHPHGLPRGILADEIKF